MENNFSFGSSSVEDRLSKLRRDRGNRFVEELLRAARRGDNTWRIAERFGVSKFLVGLLRDHCVTPRPERSVLRLVYLRAAVVLFLVVPFIMNAQPKFDLWGLTPFKHGMTEKQVASILKAQKRSYIRKENSRREDVFIVSDQVVDAVLLDGRIAHYFHFVGELFAQKHLETIRVVWLDWKVGGDNLEGSSLLTRKLYEAFLNKKPDGDGSYDAPLEFCGNQVDVFPLPVITVTITLFAE